MSLYGLKQNEDLQQKTPFLRCCKNDKMAFGAFLEQIIYDIFDSQKGVIEALLQPVNESNDLVRDDNWPNRVKR